MFDAVNGHNYTTADVTTIDQVGTHQIGIPNKNIGDTVHLWIKYYNGCNATVYPTDFYPTVLNNPVAVSGQGEATYFDGTYTRTIREYTFTIPADGKPVLSIYRYNCCVPWNAIVETTNESKCAWDIADGELVKAYNFDSNTVIYTAATNIKHTSRQDYIRVTYEDNTYMESSTNHAIYSDKGWCAYEPEKVIEVETKWNIKDVNSLFTDTGYKKIKNIEYIKLEHYERFVDISTYCHNYFANATLVHNAGCI